MKNHLIAATVLLAALSQSVMAADEAITGEETAQVTKVIETWGCKGGVIEKTPSGSYEVEDTECPSGIYDFHIGPDFVAYPLLRATYREMCNMIERS